MCDAKFLMNTKAILRFLINSRQGPQTVHSLNIDFYNYAGRDIPFYELGHSYLVTFLSSIPDTLMVNFDTLEVYPLKTPIGDTTEPKSSYFSNINSVHYTSCCHVTPSIIYQPRVLPWVLPFYDHVNRSIESNKKIFRPVPIKRPNDSSDNDNKTTRMSCPLGPRSYGDGKCSSPDQNSVTAELKDPDDHILVQKMCPDVENGNTNIYYVPLIHTELDKAEESEFDEQSENKSELSFSTSDTSTKKSGEKSLSTGSLNSDLLENMTPPPVYSEKESMTPLPVYSEKDITHHNEVVNGPNNLEIFSFSDDSSTSSEKNVPQTTTENIAVPFMFGDDDDLINMIDSGFAKEKYGAKYETSSIDTIMEVGRFYELYVSEVNNPFKFWFQLADENPNTVEELQENINSYYSMTTSYDSEDLIEKPHIKKGYACAAMYEKIWHRAEIIEEPKRESVKVFFVDYGTIGEVAIKDLRYLLDTFCSIPKLCYRGTLDFVKPINCRWDTEATSFFISLIEDVKLVAGVSEIDCKSNSVRLYLMDRERVINVNHKLVYDGFAYPEDPRDRYQRHLADVVPSFDSLEKGQHPSLDEVTNLLRRGYDIDRDVQSKIIDGIDFYIPQYISDEEALKRVENFKQERENSKMLAKQRDATVFLQFFDGILKNPFLNGTMTNTLDKSFSD